MNISFKTRKRLYLACTIVEAFTMALVNRVRSLLGRRPPPTSFDVFLGLFRLHLFGRAPRIRITCSERTDGAGAQAHTIMSAINFARACGHSYIHTPFAEIDHAERPMGEWIEAWEDLFNLGKDEERFDPGGLGAYNYSSFHPRLYHAVCNFIERAGSAPNGAEPYFHPFFFHSDSHPESYDAVIPELRAKYYSDKSPVRNDILQVAVHLRRGDVTPGHARRFTSMNTVRETCRSVKSVLDGQQQVYALSVYSQGETDDFAELQGMGANLCLDIDAIWTMQQLIEADVLIMSKSSFSYAAALISDGIKLYEPFWHAPLPHWIRLKPDGRFDRVAFDGQLKRLIDSRNRG